MIDHAAMGRPREALAQLRRLLADSANPPLRTLGAITNRFRTLIMIKELVDQRLPDMAIARQTGLQDWSVRNTRPLLRQLTLEQLRVAHHVAKRCTQVVTHCVDNLLGLLGGRFE